ncbi:MAG: hypothetical protein OXI15_01680 [Chromatiales bacterium]|nr:hypothetical protein [Chromatiales bacterium]
MISWGRQADYERREKERERAEKERERAEKERESRRRTAPNGRSRRSIRQLHGLGQEPDAIAEVQRVLAASDDGKGAA